MRKIVSAPDQNDQRRNTATGKQKPVNGYQQRLTRKADLLLKKQGDRPLRNQQRRIIARAQNMQKIAYSKNNTVQLGQGSLMTAGNGGQA